MTDEKRKGNSVVTVTYTDDGKMHVAVLGAGIVVFDKTKASRECRAHSEDHGWEQRLRDAAAISRDEETGKSATPQEKFEKVKALAEYYESGATEWARVGAGGGGRSITVEAIARLKGVEYDAAEVFVADFAKTGKNGKGEAFGGDTKKALAFLREGKRVMDTIAAIRAERQAPAKVDADAALEEIGSA